MLHISHADESAGGRWKNMKFKEQLGSALSLTLGFPECWLHLSLAA